MPALLRISANNFRSLRKVDVALGPLNVLVGPNEAGKSNFLDLIQFLGDSARLDLTEALGVRGGLDRVRFRGDSDSGAVSIQVAANVTTNSSERAPDEYELRFYSRRLRAGAAEGRQILVRNEEFRFKRTAGRGRRIKVNGDRAELVSWRGEQNTSERQLPLRSDSLALSTLAKLPDSEGGNEIRRFSQLFTSFRVFNVDVERARRPTRFTESSLRPDASNLASALLQLMTHDQIWRDFLDDARAMIPGFQNLEFRNADASEPTVAVAIVERGLRDSTYLADASFGTVRLLSLLALLYDPNPPAITCIEEIDHGLHPYLFDRLVDRLREASSRTQLLVATHSPALVNRLRPEELLIAERAEDGSTRIPAVSAERIAEQEKAAGGALQLGELWFSGSLGGVPR